MFVDSHCHLTDERLAAQREAVIARGRAANVPQIISIAVDLDDAEAVLGFADGQSVYATVGVHPQNALSWNAESAARLEALAARSGVVAVGEIGLDYLYDNTHPEYPGATRAYQEEVFEAQLDLAARLQLPIVIHNRLADERLLEVVAAHRSQLVGGVFHCFGSPPDVARRVLDLDFYLGIGGLVTFKNAPAVREVVALCPLERLLLETDAPYLAPVPQRGQINEPAFIPLIAQKIAEVKGISVEAVGQTTTRNAQQLFGLAPQ